MVCAVGKAQPQLKVDQEQRSVLRQHTMLKWVLGCMHAPKRPFCIHEPHLEIDVGVGKGIQFWPASFRLVHKQLLDHLYLPQPTAQPHSTVSSATHTAEFQVCVGTSRDIQFWLALLRLINQQVLHCLHLSQPAASAHYICCHTTLSRSWQVLRYVQGLRFQA